MARRNQLINTSATLVFGIVGLFLTIFLVSSGREELTPRSIIPVAIVLSFLWQAAKDLSDLPDHNDDPKPVKWWRVIALYVAAVAVATYVATG